MKNIFSILLIATLGMLLVFTGCKEDEYVPEPLKMVTVSGTVKGDLDLGEAGNENVPNGTKIIFRIDSRDLVQNPIAGYTYQVLQYETTVIDGAYSIELPTVKFQAVPVDIVPVDFKANQMQADDSFKEKTFWGNAITTTTQEGEVTFQDLTYNVW
ncbi:MAG TPA: hypothetical protein PKN32_12525 [Bacteroidales bacterium]|nr:hypothetical protein [Bacteroidales bacterium]